MSCESQPLACFKTCLGSLSSSKAPRTTHGNFAQDKGIVGAGAPYNFGYDPDHLFYTDPVYKFVHTNPDDKPGVPNIYRFHKYVGPKHAEINRPGEIRRVLNVDTAGMFQSFETSITVVPRCNDTRRDMERWRQ